MHKLIVEMPPENSVPISKMPPGSIAIITKDNEDEHIGELIGSTYSGYFLLKNFAHSWNSCPGSRFCVRILEDVELVVRCK